MAKPFLAFSAPDIHEEEIAEVEDCLRSGWLGSGPRAAWFEADFAACKGLIPSQVSAFDSFTAAMHVSMVAAGLEPRSEVIISTGLHCQSVPEHAYNPERFGWRPEQWPNAIRSVQHGTRA